jgi:hypothetical protein
MSLKSIWWRVTGYRKGYLDIVTFCSDLDFAVLTYKLLESYTLLESSYLISFKINFYTN